MSKLPPRVREAIQQAAEDHRLTLEAVVGRGQHATIVAARRRAAVNLRAMGFSTPEIGHYLNRHHTSVLHLLGGKSPKQTPEQRIASIPCPDESGIWAI